LARLRDRCQGQIETIDGGFEDRLSEIDEAIQDKQKELLDTGNDSASIDAIGD